MNIKNSNTKLKENTAQQKIADAIVHRTIAIQHNWAAFMQRNTERLPAWVKKFIFIFLFFSGGSYSLYLVISGFTGKRNPSIKIQVIHLPNNIDSKDHLNAAPLISDRDFQKIEMFRLYMDSLQKTLSGKRIADSIENARPGLMDSIQQLEVIYHSIKK